MGEYRTEVIGNDFGNVSLVREPSHTGPTTPATGGSLLRGARPLDIGRGRGEAAKSGPVPRGNAGSGAPAALEWKGFVCCCAVSDLLRSLSCCSQAASVRLQRRLAPRPRPRPYARPRGQRRRGRKPRRRGRPSLTEISCGSAALDRIQAQQQRGRFCNLLRKRVPGPCRSSWKKRGQAPPSFMRQAAQPQRRTRQGYPAPPGNRPARRS